MATVEFTGHDLTVRFEENPQNGREFRYRVRYECATDTVVHFVDAENAAQYTKPDGMRGYKDVLTFEENLKAGLTRSPKVFLSTQDGAGNWSAELEIDALNPAPDVPPMTWFNGYDMVRFNFLKPDDTDWAGFCVWADTQSPVRKDQITSKYIGPNNEVSLSLLPDTDYFIIYAAYDAFGTDLLNEATVQLHTLSEESILLPTLSEQLEHLSALQVKSSTAFLKVASAYSNNNHRAIEELKTSIEDGTLVSSKILILETRVDDAESILQLEQETRANADEAISQEVLLMGARVDDAETAISQELIARANADEALTEMNTQLASRIDDNEAQFNDKIQNLVDADGALSQRITDQSAVWNRDIDGKITAASQSITTAYADADGALSERIDSLSAQMGDDGWMAAIEEVSRTIADGDGALGERIDQITAGYDDQFVSIQQSMSAQGSTVDGLSAQYTLRINNGGRVSGFGLASDPNGNSEFAVLADRFLVAHAGGAEYPFEVVAGQVRIKEAVIERATIKGAQIDDLSVNTLKIAGGAITANQVATAADAYVLANGSADFITTGFMTIGDGVFGSGTIDVSFTIDATLQYDASCQVLLYTDIGSGWVLNKQITLGISTDNGNTYSRYFGQVSTVVDGPQVRVLARCVSGAFTPRSVARNFYVRDIVMTLNGAKR